MKRRGFTLIELVIALAILAVVVTMAAPVLKLQVQRQKEAELRQALRDITKQAGFPYDVTWPDQP